MIRGLWYLQQLVLVLATLVAGCSAPRLVELGSEAVAVQRASEDHNLVPEVTTETVAPAATVEPVEPVGTAERAPGEVGDSGGDPDPETDWSPEADSAEVPRGFPRVAQVAMGNELCLSGRSSTRVLYRPPLA